MAITPDEIETKVFPLVRRGYDPTAVDDFLKDVATTLAQAQGGLATPPGPPPPPPPPAAPLGAEESLDDYNRLGEEVAAILRQAHESVAQLRHRAEADAALIRQNAQREADELTRRADADRQAAAIELEAARTEADRILADVARQADGAAAAATVLAHQRTQEVIEAARAEARGAVTVQRNVRGRLEDTRDHIDQALDRLVEEDTDLFGTIDLTDGAIAEAAAATEYGGGPGDVPPPGQGPPTPPVAPPSVRTTPESNLDLPYAEDDDEDDDDGTIVVDLTEGDDGSPNGNGDDSTGGIGAGLPDDEDPGDGGGAAAPTPPTTSEAEDDALSQMVKNAVENALRRRKGDTDPPTTDPT